MHGERHRCDAVGAVIRGVFKFFSENVGVDFLVAVEGVSCLQPRHNSCAKGIDTADHRRAGVEKEPAPGIQAVEALLGDPDGEIDSPFAAAVAVKAAAM